MATDVPTRAPAARPRSRSWVADLAVAAAVTAFLVAVTGRIPAEAGERPIDGLGYAVVVLAGASTGLCRRRPGAAVVAATVALSAYLVRDHPGGPVFVTGWLALAALGWSGRRAGFAGAALLCGALVVASFVDGDAAPVLHLVFVGWSVAAVLVGDSLRTRRERLAELEQRARDLERTRDEEARRRVAEERLRIARDLHDSVAHSMATINVQAGAAAHVVDRRPEAAKEALLAIRRASGQVLDELAALLGLLREVDADGAGGAGRAPTPGLGAVADLVAATRGSLPVELAVTGPVDRVAAPVGTAAYRVVQESLTNVIRHAGPATATVTVAADHRGGLVVEVVDDGRATTAPPAGHGGRGTGVGIRGMGERVAATGGTLEAGPRPGGGFTVRATWPGAA